MAVVGRLVPASTSGLGKETSPRGRGVVAELDGSEKLEPIR